MELAPRPASRMRLLPHSLSGIAALAAVLCVSPLAAQPADTRNFLDLTVGIVGSATDGTVTLTFDDRLQGRIEVTPERGSDGDITWFPKGDAIQLSGRIDQRRLRLTPLQGEGDVRALKREEATYTASVALPATLGNTLINVRPARKIYDLQFMVIADMNAAMNAVEYVSTARTEGASSLGGGTGRRESASVPLDMGPSQLGLNVGYFMLPFAVTELSLPGRQGPLVGQASVPIPKPGHWKGDWNIAIVATWRIGNALPPVELEVDVANYASWRPEGSLADASKPGNNLVARATLKAKSGGDVRLLPKVKSIRFELTDTSREPGVCLNWPLGAEDRDFDLRLASSGSGREGKLGDGDQSYTVDDPGRDDAGQTFAEARIDSYDFGGRSTLRVMAKLDDDSEIEGVLKTESPAQTRIRLPKRGTQDWIAEAWRKERGVEKSAEDEDEEKVDGQTHAGDGYTLYEEYRGWRHGRKRLEGDPKKKDFFILNERGADVRGGIALFERVSQLRVHSRLIEGQEMSEEKRGMNVNRHDGPHLVRQHGVVILGGNGPTGAMTVGMDGAPANSAFRPKNVRWIMFEASEAGRGLGAFSMKDGLKAGLSERDAALAWDRAVAHELLHSVGVDHHGEMVRTFIPLNFQGPTNPINPTGQPRWVYQSPPPTWEWYVQGSDKLGAEQFSSDRGPTVTVLWEDTKQPIYQDILPAYNDWLPKFRMAFTAENMTDAAAQLSYAGKSAAFWAELAATESAARITRDGAPSLYMGADNGTDSGNELCVMRYHFANGYRKKGEQDSYYMIRPGTNKAGRDICRSPAGTGGNAPDHAPQPRFGKAASGRGDCFSQICPNDRIPPRRTN